MKLHLLAGSRSRILAGIVLVIAAVFVGRLFYLQIVQHAYYTELAQVEQVKRELLPAERGEIYAFNGDEPVKLVLNETVYTVFADPAIITDVDETANVLKEIAGGNVRENFEDLLAQSKTRYQVIATRVTRTQAEKIKEHDLTGIGFTAVSQRVYPEGRLASQLLGFVNAEGTGNYGVEGYMNELLKGVDGRLETVTDVSDVPLTIGDRNIREQAQDGDDIVLSIDRNVQAKVEEALKAGAERTGADNASAIVMDPNSGRVLAMANLPDYDPAVYYSVEDVALFNNAVVSTPYEPGSVLKTYTLATGLDKNVIKPDTTFYNTDSIVIGQWNIQNFTRGITGNITMQTALEWSLNTGFVTIGQRLGDGSSINQGARNTMYEYFHDRLGLGQLTGIQLANEAAGTLASPDSSEGNEVKYANITFGQGMNATMLQVATGFSAIVNGGNFYAPTIVSGTMVDGEYVPDDAAGPMRTGVVSAETSATVRSMMETARSKAFAAQDKAGYSIGGKTGTAQVAVPGGYSDTETIGSYLGYGGTDTPEYVIMVAVSGKDKIFGGSADAMPIFTDISNWMIDYLKIQPKG